MTSVSPDQAAGSTPPGLRAKVGTTFAYGVTDVRSALLSFAVSSHHVLVSEELTLHVGGEKVVPAELVRPDGTRMYQLEDVGSGWLEVTYDAVVDLGAPTPTPPGPDLDYDRWLYQRQSRYAESDRLAAMAARTFPQATGIERVNDIATWVHEHLSYISGSSRGTDGAVDTLLAGQGVCRDYAHVVVALLRALGTPARLVSVYAPGLAPMDFHAVAEAFVEGDWHVVDATRLAPRQSMVRIATGRDAADTAFLTTTGGLTEFNRQEVRAEVVDGELPVDDPTAPVRLP